MRRGIPPVILVPRSGTHMASLVAPSITGVSLVAKSKTFISIIQVVQLRFPDHHIMSQHRTAIEKRIKNKGFEWQPREWPTLEPGQQLGFAVL
jgi:hypothetical protein